MPHTIVIAGYYGFGNTGDELILDAMIQNLREVIPDVNIVVLSGKPRQTASRYQVGSVSWMNISQIEKTIRGADLVILGSGGIFHDYWGFDQSAILTSEHIGISFYTSVALLASIHHKPLMLYAVGVGPLVTEKGKTHVKAIAEQAALITVRDKQSVKILRDLGVAEKRVTLAADPVMGLTLQKKTDSEEKKQLGIVLRNWNVGVEPDHWERCVAGAVDEFLDNHPEFEAFFIPFQYATDPFLDDRGVARRISKRLRNAKRTQILERSLNPHLKGDLLAGCDLVLGMRLHSLIVAAGCGIPMVGLSYDPKVENYLNQVGLSSYSIDLTAISDSIILERLNDAWSHQDELRALLLNKKVEMADLASKSVLQAFELLSNSNARARLICGDLQGILEQTALSLVKELDTKKYQIAGLKQQLTACDEREVGLTERISNLEQLLEREKNNYSEIQKKIVHLRAQQCEEIHLLNQQIEVLKKQNLERQKEQEFLLQELAAIKGSRGWKLLWRLWQVRLFLIPRGSKRERWIKAMVASVKRAFISSALTIRGLLRVFTGWSGSRRSGYAKCFLRYKKQRSRIFSTDFRKLQVTCCAGLVSVIMPLYNGSKYVRDAIESILGQTYGNLELIIVDDGSTDNSGLIADEYQNRDVRVKVVHQPNRKLPAALNTGFALAKGEFLTWTSDDNLLKPDCLKKMVACLERHPSWDMVYANMDIIGDDGQVLRHSAWFEGYQYPHGSEHIYLPNHTNELNTYANNFIGGAFLYRKRVHHLLAGYSPWQFTREDYDYWMQVNALLTLRHSTLKQPVYSYRFHARSLTSQDESLKITSGRKFLMVFDDFRRDFYLMPMLWVIHEVGESQRVKNLTDAVKKIVVKQSGIVLSQETFGRLNLPRLFLPVIHLHIAPGLEGIPTNLPADRYNSMLFSSNSSDLEHNTDSSLLHIQCDNQPDHSVKSPGKPDHFSSSDLEVLLDALDIHARSAHLKQIEKEISDSAERTKKLSVVVCSYKRNQSLEDNLMSLARQTAEKREFEVVVVDNSPGDSDLEETIERIRKDNFFKEADILRLVHCPVLGLSFARNAGIAEARGEIILFLDDDAIADPDLVQQYLDAFANHKEMGVIGGHITLKRPETINMVWKEGWERYWSQFITGYRGLTEVKEWWEFPWGANWGARRKALLQIGGFRGRYGRHGNDFSGGEEIIAARLIQQLGYSIGVLPQAHVLHQVDPSRFTLEHLKKTICAGALVHYQEQRDLYFPAESHNKNILAQICKVIWRSAIARMGFGKKPLDAERLESLYKLDAQYRLLKVRLKNWIKGG